VNEKRVSRSNNKMRHNKDYRNDDAKAAPSPRPLPLGGEGASDD